MKKLMVLIAAVAVAGVASAASFDWKTSNTGKVQVPGGASTFSGTAYLFSTADYTQAAMFDALVAGGSVGSLTSLASKSVSSGVISAGTTFNWGAAGDTLTAYVVIQDGDNFFISDTKSAVGDASATQSMSFALKTASSKALDTTGSYSGAGWYGKAVPEPTSGLLMLVGLGALALRRRRA